MAGLVSRFVVRLKAHGRLRAFADDVLKIFYDAASVKHKTFEEKH